jgi:hypothetical protein
VVHGYQHLPHIADAAQELSIVESGYLKGKDLRNKALDAIIIPSFQRQR